MSVKDVENRSTFTEVIIKNQIFYFFEHAVEYLKTEYIF